MGEWKIPIFGFKMWKGAPFSAHYNKDLLKCIQVGPLFSIIIGFLFLFILAVIAHNLWVL